MSREVFELSPENLHFSLAERTPAGYRGHHGGYDNAGWVEEGGATPITTQPPYNQGEVVSPHNQGVVVQDDIEHGMEGESDSESTKKLKLLKKKTPCRKIWDILFRLVVSALLIYESTQEWLVYSDLDTGDVVLKRKGSYCKGDTLLKVWVGLTVVGTLAAVAEILNMINETFIDLKGTPCFKFKFEADSEVRLKLRLLHNFSYEHTMYMKSPIADPVGFQIFVTVYIFCIIPLPIICHTVVLFALFITPPPQKNGKRSGSSLQRFRNKHCIYIYISIPPHPPPPEARYNTSTFYHTV